MTTTDLCPGCGGTGLVAGSPFLEETPTPWPDHLAHVVDACRGLPPESSWTFTGGNRPVPCPRCGGLRVVAPPLLVVGASGGLELLATGPAEQLAFYRRFALPAPAPLRPVPPWEDAPVEAARESAAQAARQGPRGAPRKSKRDLAAAAAVGRGQSVMFGGEEAS